jgi:hypothetical protein
MKRARRWSHRLVVRTPASHVGNAGSTPAGITKRINAFSRLGPLPPFLTATFGAFLTEFGLSRSNSDAVHQRRSNLRQLRRCDPPPVRIFTCHARSPLKGAGATLTEIVNDY